MSTGKRFTVSHHVKIVCIEDITNRVDYRSEVDVASLSLVDVVEPYHLPEKGGMYPCGIKTCKTDHFHGFLVRTSDGKETNIGKDCGRKHFPEQFILLSNRASAHARERNRHQTLNKTLDHVDEIQDKLENLKRQKYGASWLYNAKNKFLYHYPDDICQELKSRAIRNLPNIIVERERTSQEIDDLHAGNPSVSRNSLRYISEVVNQVRGLMIFRKDIRDVLVKQIQNTLRELVETDPQTASKRKIKELYDWCIGLDDKFTEAELILNEGRKFFQTSNIQGLRDLPITDNSKIVIDILEWSYDGAKPTEESLRKLERLQKKKMRKDIEQLEEECE